jgi:hypothetical protein
MSTSKELMIELADLTRLYLLQEHEFSDWILSEATSYAFFKKISLASKNPARPPAQNPPEKTIPENKQVTQAKSTEPQKPLISPPINEKTTLPPPIASAPKKQVEEPVKAPGQLSPSKPDKRIKLEPIKEPPVVDFSDIRAAVAERCPNLKIIDAIPDDALAKIASHKQNTAQAAFLLSEISSSYDTFISDIVKAIDTHLVPAAKVNAAAIEKEGSWDSFLNKPGLKLILIQQNELQKMPKLLKYFTKGLSEDQGVIGQVPVFLLADVATFFNDPEKKRVLWSKLRLFFNAAR